VKINYTLLTVAFVGVATWLRNDTATYPPATRAISSQTPTWWTANGVYWWVAQYYIA